MIFYHVTPIDRLNAILTEGLKVNAPQTIGDDDAPKGYKQNVKGKIFLDDTVHVANWSVPEWHHLRGHPEALEGIYTEKQIKEAEKEYQGKLDDKWAMLAVKLSDSDAKWAPAGYFTRKNIAPENIQSVFIFTPRHYLDRKPIKWIKREDYVNNIEQAKQPFFSNKQTQTANYKKSVTKHKGTCSSDNMSKIKKGQ
jgi:hypothetical protein